MGGNNFMSGNILNSNFVKEVCEATANMYRLGWDERNGGNISYLLEEEELSEYLDLNKVHREIPIDFEGSELAGKYFIVTGSGVYFKNIEKHPENGLGIIRISEGGQSVELLWGFEDGTIPTSELPSHLMSHQARLEVDSENRVVMHCHATHLLAMTYTQVLDEREFTKTLWKMSTECLVVFPEGIGIIPWIVPGTNEIGEATSEKMKDHRMVLWPQHGVYGAGKDLDETFGLIETAEKAASVFTFANAQGPIINTIEDDELEQLGKSFGVVPKEGYLS